MLKHSHFSGETECGPVAVPLLGKSDSVFEKTAAPKLLPEVTQYIAGLKPRNDSQYVLVNAMGAGEFYGNNVNGDFFTEESLIHAPPDWTGNPVVDRIRAETWPYGYPTFYLAHPYAHHRNKDASRAFGEVELAAWNPEMRRVELVTRVDYAKCMEYGGQGTWDKLKAGGFPDVSMGTKVPFDTCSICLDWEAYNRAKSTFDPSVHKHEGEAILAVHKQMPIRGLAVTRRDYCDHALRSMNNILPDGRKVFVYNDYPKFFDISFVFIGADRTAKTMLFIFSGGVPHSVKTPEAVAIPTQDVGVKAASVTDFILEQAFSSKMAELKQGEIDKNVVPSQFAGKAIPLLTKNECDIPNEVIDRLSSVDPAKALSTLGGMGIIMKPREFQRLILIQLGDRSTADDLDSQGEVFEKSDESEPMGLSHEKFMPVLANLLSSLIPHRSLLAPAIENRVTMSDPEKLASIPRAPSHSRELLDKIGSAYNGYRKEVMDLVAHSQHLLSSVGAGEPLRKMAAADSHAIFSPLSAAYLLYAFDEEYGRS
jgi:hypothetical protein